jgi:hypothetical protein
LSANAQKRYGNKLATKAIINRMSSSSSTNERGSALSLPPSEAEMSLIVEAGGGKYVGVLMAIPNKMESIILFMWPQTRTTLGVPISKLTVEAVREQLAESNAAFGGLSSKSRNHKDVQ